MNIIIPIGGTGKRFQDDNYKSPKPLVKSLGKPILFWNIENILTKAEDTIFIVYRKEFDVYNFQDLINNKFDKKIKFISIENDTRGASETVLYALNNMDEQELGEITLVLDSDNFFNEDILEKCKESNDNIIFYTKDESMKTIYSFIKLNENNEVLEIEEKNKISDFACVGAYCFKNGFLLKKEIENILFSNIKQKNEFYISLVYKNLIKNGEKILSHKINDFHCLGTPNQVKSFSSSFTNNTEKYRFCFDLDNTLVSYPKIKNDYSSVEPIQRNIDFCNFLKENGHTIIIYTARRMRTHNGNIDAVISDIGKITIESLNKFNIQYDEIIFGKPYAHFYIDDLAVKSYEDLEKETGFYNIHPKTRSHNKLEIEGNVITKISNSIEGEKYFYKNIPEDISNYFPKLIDSGNDYIKISKVDGVPISFIYTSKILNETILTNILNTIDKIHNSNTSTDRIDLYGNYLEKIEKRVNCFNFESYPDFNKIKKETADFLKQYQENNQAIFKVIHGDPVFTNILINNNDELKFIDMRGKVGDEITIFGDIFYDYSKIYQSLIGYDFILMNKEIDSEYIRKNKLIFEKFIVEKFGQEKMSIIKEITKSLIITLIPIHNDEKCKKYFSLIDNV